MPLPRAPDPDDWGLVEAFTGTEDQEEGLINWLAGRMKALKRYKTDTIARGAHMQRQFTIELRVDFEDQEKLPVLQQVLQQAARHAFATAKLISDNEKTTQVAIFSDDWFSGHEEISLLDDVIQKGKDAMDSTAAPAEPEISDEMKEMFGGS